MRDLRLEVSDLLLKSARPVLLSLQPVAYLLELDALMVELMLEVVALNARLLDESDHLVEIDHYTNVELAAKSTLNVNDGVVPVMAHATRCNGANVVGKALVTVAVVV